MLKSQKQVFFIFYIVFWFFFISIGKTTGSDKLTATSTIRIKLESIIDEEHLRKFPTTKEDGTTIVELSENDFQEMFPKNVGELDLSDCAGRIVKKIRRSEQVLEKGSGFLLDIIREEENYMGIGLSAIHNFLYEDPQEHELNIRKDMQFIQGSKMSSLSSKPFIYSKIDINEVFTFANTDEYKDVCLFKGKIEAISPFNIEEIKSMVKKLNVSEQFIRKEQTDLIDENGFILQFVDKIQRINMGKLDFKTNTHRIITIPGCSGGPVFAKLKSQEYEQKERDRLVGVHRGTPIESLIPGKKIRVTDERRAERRFYDVTSENIFVLFYKEDYEALYNHGIDILKWNLSDDCMPEEFVKYFESSFKKE